MKPIFTERLTEASKNVKTKGGKKRSAKRKPCEENGMWREEMPREGDVTQSGWKDIGVKRCHQKNIVSRRSCQESEMTRAMRRNWHPKKRTSREPNVKEKGFQEMTQGTDLTARRPGVFPTGSLLSACFPSLKLPSPGLPGLYQLVFI